MDIRHLRNMLAVLETGSVNKAAQQLGITQPALSKSLQRLEAFLGAPLFNRDAKGMRPTVYGRSLIDFARATCVGFEQSRDEIKALKTGSSGLVTLCGPPLIAHDIFPEAVIRTRERHPGIRIRIIEQIDRLFEVLLEGKCDLLAATMTANMPRAGIRRMWLFDDHLVIVARPGHPVTRLRNPSARRLRHFKWIFPNAGNLHRLRLERFFESQNEPLPSPVAETSAPNLLKSIVLRTDCIALVGKMGVQSELETGTLEYLPINSPFMLRPVGVVWRSNHLLSAAATNVLNTVEQLCRERGHSPRLMDDDHTA